MIERYGTQNMQASYRKIVFRLHRKGAKLILFLLGCIVLVVGSMSCDPGAGGDVSQTPEATLTPRATNTPLPTKTPGPSYTPTTSSTPVCHEQQGRLEAGEYRSTLLREQVPYLIYLPSCYRENVREYPALYLLHGFPFDETHWIDLGFIDWVDRAISSNLLPELLMVMPRAPEPLFTSSDGGPGSYEVEFIEDLLPTIEQNYPVDSRTQTRALAGISRGGVWALEIAFRNTDLFGAVIALSPALNVNYARPSYDPFVLVSEDRGLPAEIFLSAGKGEPSFRKATERLGSTLEEYGIKHTYVITQGGHDAEGWMLVFDDVLVFLADCWMQSN